MSIKNNEIKRGDNSIALKAGSWYVISSFLVKAISFITTPIFARVMTKVDYGEFSNFASWQAVLIIITGAELYNTLNRAYYDYKDDYDSYISSVTIAGMLFTCIAYVIFLIFQDVFLQVVTIPKEYIHLLFFLLLFTSCKQVYLAREKTMYRYKSVAWLTFISLIVPTAISLVAVVAFPNVNMLAGRLYGFYVPSALIGVICMIPLLKNGKCTFKWEHCKYAFVIALPLVVHYLTSFILTSTNTIIAKNCISAEAASSVSISNSTIHILTVFFQAVSGAVTTWLMDNLEQKNIKKVRRGSTLYVLMIAIIAVGVILFAPEVIGILGGRKYMSSVYLIPGFVLGIFFQAAATLFTIILTYNKSVSKISIAAGLVAVGSIVAKVLCVSKMGIVILSIVNAIAFAVLFFVYYYLVRQVGFSQYIDMKFCMMISCIVLLGAVGSTLLYGNTLLRYGVIGVLCIAMGIVMILNKDKIKEIVKTFSKKKVK